MWLDLLLAAAVQAPSLATLGPPPGAGVRVVLVRHGQAFSNLDPEPDLPPEQLDRLTELGRKQAAQAAAALTSLGVAAILSSPAGRAQESAAVIGAALGLKPRAAVETRLRPLELGRKPGGEPLDWDARIADWEAGKDPVPAGGESLAQVGARVAALVAGLRTTHAGQTLVLVAHSEVIGAYLGELRGVPGSKRWPPSAANGSLTIVDAGPGAPAVRLENWTPPAR